MPTVLKHWGVFAFSFQIYTTTQDHELLALVMKPHACCREHINNDRARIWAINIHVNVTVSENHNLNWNLLIHYTFIGFQRKRVMLGKGIPLTLTSAANQGTLTKHRGLSVTLRSGIPQ